MQTVRLPAIYQLYPKIPLALQGTTHTWLELETAKEESQTNGGEKRPKVAQAETSGRKGDSRSKSQASSLGMWLSLCEGSPRHPSPGPPPCLQPGGRQPNVLQLFQADCKSLGLQCGGAATRAMPTLAGPHSPRPPPQAFLFTKNVHCRHLPRAWVTMDWVCFLEPFGGRNFLIRKGMSKKCLYILARKASWLILYACKPCARMPCMCVCVCVLSACSALLTLSCHHPDKPWSP